MIINEREIKESQVLKVGKLMLIAARTAPKGKGMDNLEAILISGKDLQALADFMEAGVQRHGRLFFIRDAANIRLAQAVVVLGAKMTTMGLSCGYCGYPTCEAKDEAGEQFPCVFPVNDLGIAIGSACATAADHRVDTRVMFSAGVAALELGWLGPDVKVAFAIPISATSKNPFFDRVSTRPVDEKK
jgi:uncharacterized ferredoxin-like protein